MRAEFYGYTKGKIHYNVDNNWLFDEIGSLTDGPKEVTTIYLLQCTKKNHDQAGIATIFSGRLSRSVCSLNSHFGNESKGILYLTIGSCFSVRISSY